MEKEREKEIIAGRNAVAEALRAGRPIDSVYVRRGDRTGSVNAILRMARDAGVTIKDADPRKLDAMCAGENHQGVAARCGRARVFRNGGYLRAGGKPRRAAVSDRLRRDRGPAQPRRDHPHGGMRRRARRRDPEAAQRGADRRGGQGPPRARSNTCRSRACRISRRSRRDQGARRGSTRRTWTAPTGAKPIFPARRRSSSARRVSAFRALSKEKSRFYRFPAYEGQDQLP